MHRILIILGLSVALASCGGDDENGDSSSRDLAPSSSPVVTASGPSEAPVDRFGVAIAGRPAG